MVVHERKMVLTELVLLITTATRVASLPPLTLPFTSKQSLDLQEAPDQLLKAFGLSEPGVRRRHTEPPQYMLDLYNEVADSSGHTRLPGPYGATIVRAFSEEDGGRDSIFSFSVNGPEEDEQVLEAEFHVYHSRLPKAQRHLLEDNIYKMEVYWASPTGRQVVRKQHVAAHSSGWRIFKVGSSVVAPRAGSEEDERRVILEVTASTIAGRPLPLNLHHGAHGTRQPLLILFSAHSDTNGTTTTTTPLPAKEMKKKFESPSVNRVRRSTEENTTAVVVPTGCERRNMTVDFDSIGWSSWIVYPQVYDAFQCIGLCNFPLGQNLNPTNHATVQSIIHHSGESPEVQQPCCVPSSYANLTILFYDSEENVVLKQYDQMVALQCGCH